jgi:hypothetical protein
MAGLEHEHLRDEAQGQVDHIPLRDLKVVLRVLQTCFAGLVKDQKLTGEQNHGNKSCYFVREVQKGHLCFQPALSILRQIVLSYKLQDEPDSCSEPYQDCAVIYQC